MGVMLGDVELVGYRVDTGEHRELAEHHVPGLDGSVFQDMGTEPVSISLEGVIYGKEAMSGLEQLRSKFKTGEPVPFVADVATATEVTEVLIKDLTVAELAGRPDYFRYVIKLQQYESPNSSALEQIQQEQIAQESLGDAGAFIKNTEKLVELDTGLKELGVENIKIGDYFANITDLLKELGLLDLFGYSAPTFAGKLFQVSDDLLGGLVDMGKEKEAGGKVAVMVKTFALILGKAILTKVSAEDQGSWGSLVKGVGKAVSG